MRTFVLIAAIFGCSFSYSQEDSLRSKDVDEIVIKVIRKKEIAYSDSRHYILDFQVGSTGTYLLLNRFRRYHLYALNNSMQPEIKIEIMFHPKALYQDCAGELYILSKDSMYQFEKQKNELLITNTYPISRYDVFLKNCVATNSEALIFKTLGYNNQSTQFYQKHKYNGMSSEIYRIQDSSTLRSVKETQQDLVNEEKRLLRTYGRNKNYRAPTWEDRTQEGLPQSDAIREIRNHLSRQQFFTDFIIKPYYNPLFVLDDTTYIFDHVNSKMVRLDNHRRELDKVEISYHNERKWKGEMHLDAGSGVFYSVQEVHGAQIFGLLAMDSIEIKKRTKLTKHAYPEKVIVFKGYAYYIYRQYCDDNLNKLFRQRL
ncbi:MAG: hypothetical protein ACI865_003057 [Flavobacteriaceae bacterium]|jgi:hypothetical protein